MAAPGVSELDPLLARHAAATAPPVGRVAGLPTRHRVGGDPDRADARWPRRLLLGAAAVRAAGVAYYAVTLYQVHSTGRSDQARPVDAIVVMGAAQYDGGRRRSSLPGSITSSSCGPTGLAKVVVVTGGKQPGDRFTEAEASANYLIDRGVPAAAILQENARAQLRMTRCDGVRDLLHDRGLFRGAAGHRPVPLVADPADRRRSSVSSPTCRRRAPARCAAARRSAKEMQGGRRIALGRIIGFKRLLSITG